MFTANQIAQLIMQVEPVFAAQLELTQKIQQQSQGSSRLRPVTPARIVTPPLPPGVGRDSPLGLWDASFANLINAGQNLTAQISPAKEEMDKEIASTRQKALNLKNAYRTCFMAMANDASPEQANAIYTHAQTQANAAFEAAHTHSDNNPYQIAKAHFLAHFSAKLATHQAMKTPTPSPVAKPDDATPSSPTPRTSLFDRKDSSESDVEDIDMTNLFESLSLNKP